MRRARLMCWMICSTMTRSKPGHSCKSWRLFQSGVWLNVLWTWAERKWLKRCVETVLFYKAWVWVVLETWARKWTTQAELRSLAGWFSPHRVVIFTCFWNFGFGSIKSIRFQSLVGRVSSVAFSFCFYSLVAFALCWSLLSTDKLEDSFVELLM